MKLTAKNWSSTIVLISVLATGCATQQGAKQAAMVAIHAYDLLVEFNRERPGYGMHTYVIFGREVTGRAAPEPIEERYLALLKAIESSTDTAARLEKAEFPLRQTNLFCIPAKFRTGGPTLGNYNYELARIYRRVAMGSVVADTAFVQKLSTSPGPFLISTLQPLNQVKSPSPMLFADLSKHNPAAMPEVVAAYKERLSLDLSKGELFDPIRLRLLTLVLDADDNVKLLKEAVADWLPN